MDEKKMLNDEELEEVSGGKVTVISEEVGSKVSFEIEYSGHTSRWELKNRIQQELLNRGVPQHVVNTVPVMNPEKSYMSYGSGGMRVEWEPGWATPQYTKTHD
ncbi:MAG: hypothetical protein PUG48_00415 [Clostridia bacterium]|nr:hypothetical protein [Clostridia bacterium]